MGMEKIKFTVTEPEPLIVVISGLSGAGKDTVICRMKEISDNDFHFVVTCNTRKRRETEVDGKDYHFISRERFREMIRNNEMVEYSEVYDDMKGVPRFEIEKAFALHKNMILRLDYQGMKKIRAAYPRMISIFILPPDAETWLSRLRERNTETEESLKIRIQTAARELAEAPEFDYIVINDDLDKAAEDILTILRAESMRCTPGKVVFSCHE